MMETPCDFFALGRYKAIHMVLEYVLECSLEQPFGAMHLTVKAVGPVKLSVCPGEFMIAEDAFGHPEFGHDETRAHQLRTIE